MNILVDEYADNLVKLDATHSNMQMRLVEIRMDKRWQISEVKIQLERRFGSAVEDQ